MWSYFFLIGAIGGCIAGGAFGWDGLAGFAIGELTLAAAVITADYWEGTT